MNSQSILISLLILAVIYMILDKNKSNRMSKRDGTDFSKAYQAKYLLTKNEWYEYKKLNKLAAEKGLRICPKVRVLDIIEPRKDQKNYLALINKVQSKHVDFLVTDEDLRIKGVIELDDNSHNSMKRQNRDDFLNTILESVGYIVVRTRSITEDTLKVFESDR